MNKKEKWTRVEAELPDTPRDVIVVIEDMPDWSKGVYMGDEGTWITPYEDSKVIAWIDAPEIPAHISNPFTFRNVKEARYLSAVARDAINKNRDYEKFFKIRTEILEATTKGLTCVIIENKYFNEGIFCELANSGFVVKTIDDDKTGIYWD